MKLLSLISRAFEERQYRRACLKLMHESLKDCSERILASVVYHTSPATVQPWKNQDERMKKRHEEYYTGQED